MCKENGREQAELMDLLTEAVRSGLVKVIESPTHSPLQDGCDRQESQDSAQPATRAKKATKADRIAAAVKARELADRAAAVAAEAEMAAERAVRDWFRLKQLEQAFMSDGSSSGSDRSRSRNPDSFRCRSSSV